MLNLVLFNQIVVECNPDLLPFPWALISSACYTNIPVDVAPYTETKQANYMACVRLYFIQSNAQYKKPYIKKVHVNLI